MKNEKFLLDIQTKCGDIANEILNAAIDAERNFKCKWPYPKKLPQNCFDSFDCSSFYSSFYRHANFRIFVWPRQVKS